MGANRIEMLGQYKGTATRTANTSTKAKQYLGNVFKPCLTEHLSYNNLNTHQLVRSILPVISHFPSQMYISNLYVTKMYVSNRWETSLGHGLILKKVFPSV